MREIKYRGRRIDNGLWAYGYFVKTPITTEFRCDGQFLDSGGKGRYCIVQEGVAHEIDIKTLGEFTGLKDINSAEIYEGDIVKGEFDLIGEIKWGVFNVGCNGYEYGFNVIGPYVEEESLYDDLTRGRVKDIGNIYENPELLEVSE